MIFLCKICLLKCLSLGILCDKTFCGDATHTSVHPRFRAHDRPKYWYQWVWWVTYRNTGEGLLTRADMTQMHHQSPSQYGWWQLTKAGNLTLNLEAKYNSKRKMHLTFKFSKQSENWVWRLVIGYRYKTEPVRNELNDATPLPCAVSDNLKRWYSLSPVLFSCH